MKYAPILISVYDRFKHFKKCIESLKKNINAKNTILYIASDGPKCKKSKLKVSQVRDYIKSINGFKKINFFSTKENSNKKIVFETRDKMVSDFDRYICTEDDNIFSPFFIDFMNKCLNIYADDPNISAICGYNLPNFPYSNKNELVALKLFSAYGYGTWRDKDLTYNLSHKFKGQLFAKKTLTNKKLFLKINERIPNVIPLLESMLVNTKFLPRDVINTVLLIKKNKVCVFPSYSLVRNIGNDGSGENNSTDFRIKKQKLLLKNLISYNLNYLDKSTIHTLWIKNFLGGNRLIVRNKFFYWYLSTKFFFS